MHAVLPTPRPSLGPTCPFLSRSADPDNDNVYNKIKDILLDKYCNGHDYDEDDGNDDDGNDDSETELDSIATKVYDDWTKRTGQPVTLNDDFTIVYFRCPNKMHVFYYDVATIEDFVQQHLDHYHHLGVYDLDTINQPVGTPLRVKMSSPKRGG